MSGKLEWPGRARSAAAGARSATRGGLGRQAGGQGIRSGIFLALLFIAVCVALIGLALILITAFLEGRSALSMNLLRDDAGDEIVGYRPAIFGTLYVIGFMILMVIPLGVGAAVYLEEYADRDRWWNRLFEINIQNLAAVPSIIYGILGLAFIVRGPLSLGFILVTGSMTLALLVLPVVIISAREAIRAVPPSIREGSLALGASPWQTIWGQTLPAAVPGILTGVILAVSRATGEAAALLLLGAATFVTFNPEPLQIGWTSLPVQIYEYAKRPQEEFRVAAAAGVIVILGVILLINSVAIWLRNRFERTW